jgi:hypothetical protein
MKHLSFVLLSLALFGCAGTQYFEARAIEDFDKPGSHHRTIFHESEPVALVVLGDGWYNRSAHVDVERVSDRKQVYHGKTVLVADGQRHSWTVHLPPGKYLARAYEGDEQKLVWEFSVVK